MPNIRFPLQNFAELKDLIESSYLWELNHKLFRSAEVSAAYAARATDREAMLEDLRNELAVALQFHQGEPYAITPCAFPYDVLVSDFADHYVFWSSMPTTVGALIIEATYPSKEYVMLVNPPERKTVPELEHFHFFIRRY